MTKRKRRTQRQKFYDECLLRTFRDAKFNDENPLSKSVSKLGGDIQEMELPEILMKWNLMGLEPVPEKEDFEKWGVRYLCQLLGFVQTQDDMAFTDMYFSFLEGNKSLWNGPEKTDFGDLCWNVLIDNSYKGSRHFAEKLGDFLIFNFKDAEWFGDFLKVAYAMGMLTSKGADEYYRIKHGKTPLEAVAEISNQGNINDV